MRLVKLDQFPLEIAVPMTFQVSVLTGYFLKGGGGAPFCRFFAYFFRYGVEQVPSTVIRRSRSKIGCCVAMACLAAVVLNACASGRGARPGSSLAF